MNPTVALQPTRLQLKEKQFNPASFPYPRSDGFLRFRQSRCFTGRAGTLSAVSIARTPVLRRVTHLHSASARKVVTTTRRKRNGGNRTILSTEDGLSRKLTRRFVFLIPGRGRDNCKHSCCLGQPARCGSQQKAALGDRSDAATRPACSGYYGNCSSPVCPCEDIAAGPACPSPSKGVLAIKPQVA